MKKKKSCEKEAQRANFCTVERKKSLKKKKCGIERKQTNSTLIFIEIWLSFLSCELFFLSLVANKCLLI